MGRSRKELAVFLSSWKTFENPNAMLEQHPTDGDTAAKLLWQAYGLRARTGSDETRHDEVRARKARWLAAYRFGLGGSMGDGEHSRGDLRRDRP